MIKFTEGGIAFLVVSNRDVKRVAIQKVGIDYYIVSFCEDLQMHGAIRVRHSRLYVSKETAEAAINERASRRPETLPRTPCAPIYHGTHWDYE